MTDSAGADCLVSAVLAAAGVGIIIRVGVVANAAFRTVVTVIVRERLRGVANTAFAGMS